MAFEIFHDFFAYDFGGEGLRPLDLQAFTVEGGIPSQAWLRLRVNSASRQSHPTSRDIENFESANEELGHEQRLLIFAGNHGFSWMTFQRECNRDCEGIWNGGK